MTGPTPVDKVAAQDAVKRMSAQLSDVVRSASHPDRKALGEWNVADVAIHVSHTFNLLTATARGGGSIMDNVWDLGSMTKIMVGGEADRDLSAVADRIDANAAEFLAAMQTIDPNDSHEWIVEGIKVPTSTILCHVLNEAIMHGYDIATAEGLPWRVERADAALVVNGFLFFILPGLGSSMVQDHARDETAAVEIRVRGGGAAVFRFDKGVFTVVPPSGEKVDCHLSVDPWGFLLVAWDRKSQWGQIARGRLFTWGRKPWVALKLRGMIKTP